MAASPGWMKMSSVDAAAGGQWWHPMVRCSAEARLKPAEVKTDEKKKMSMGRLPPVETGGKHGPAEAGLGAPGRALWEVIGGFGK